MGTVHRLSTAGADVTLGDAVSAFLATLDHPESAGTRRVYSGPLRALVQQFGAAAPAGGLDPDAVAEWFTAQWGERSPARWNVVLVAIRSAAAYWAEQGWTANDPAVRLRRRKTAPDRDRALSRDQVEAILTCDGVSLRDKTLYRMLYESAARANEVLRLDIADLDLPNRCARVMRKGGAMDLIVWQSGTARLLPRLLKGRTSGPVFLTERRARTDLGLSPHDVDPASGKARLSYFQAWDRFREASGGATLHQLRHSALTHDAEDGTSTVMLMARSGHTSVRSLSKYARISSEALKRHQAERDPARRR